MGVSSGKIDLDSITVEQVEELYDWLQGKSCPDELDMQGVLTLSEEEAFSVIYFLQEHMNVLPDKFERCHKCGTIYDSYNEGITISEGSTVVDDENNEIDANFPKEYHGCYCDECRPDGYSEWKRIMGTEDN